jgi:lipopolysaccharide exporter
MSHSPTPRLGREASTAIRWNSVATVAATVMQFAQLVVLARFLAPAEFGLAATAMAISAFAQGFADLGLVNALVQKMEVEEKVWSSALWACFFSGVLLLVLTVTSSFGLQALMHMPGLAPLLIVAALALPWVGPAAVFQASMQRELQFSRLALIEIAANTGSLVVALTWALWQRNAMALILAQVAGLVMRCGLFFFASHLHLSFRIQRQDLRALARYGGYQMGERAINAVAGNWDRLLIARLLGAEAAGFYSLASQIAIKPANMLTPFIFRTLFPLLSRLQQEKERLAFTFLRSTSLLGFGVAGVYALLFGLSDSLTFWVLGAGWGPVAPLLRILVGLGFIWTITQPLGVVTLALGHARVVFWVGIMALVANAAGVLCGAGFGLRGVALGMLAGGVVLLPVDFYLAKTWLAISPRRLSSAVHWTFIPAMVTSGTLCFSNRLPLWQVMPRPVALILEGGLGLGLYFLLAFAMNRQGFRDVVDEIRVKLWSSKPA